MKTPVLYTNVAVHCGSGREGEWWERGVVCRFVDSKTGLKVKDRSAVSMFGFISFSVLSTF